MADVYQAPEAGPARDPYLGMTTDGMLVVAMAELLVAAGISGCFMALTALMTVVSLVVDIPTEPGDPPMWVIAPIETAFCALPTALYGLGAVGVYRRAKWGWGLALIGFGLWMGGCAMPLGLFGFYALLREDGRRAFGMAGSSQLA